MQFYVNKNGHQLGPFTEETLAAKVASGELDDDDLCLQEGLSNWRAIREVLPHLSTSSSPFTEAPQHYPGTVFGSGSFEQQNPYASPALHANEPISDVSDDLLESEFRPFKTIWTAPRRTVRRIIAVDPSLHVIALVCLAGVGQALDRASSRNAGDNLPLAAILGTACLVGPLGGIFMLWLGSHMIQLTGKWIGGVGKREHIKTAIAWSYVPSAFAVLLWIPMILLVGIDVFTNEMPSIEAQPLLLAPFLAIVFTQVVLALWSFVLLCNTIAEVQRFRSAWRGLGNILLAALVLFVTFFTVVIAVAVLST
jgi:hypothetical protein